MNITVAWLEKRFDAFNHTIFNDELPRIPIELSNAKTFLGLCVYDRHRNLFGKVERCNFRLRISTRYDLTEQEVEDVLIHEMIHYCIHYKRVPDTSAHGKVFRKMMALINTRFNRHITISHRRGTEVREERRQSASYKIVAWVHFTNGDHGFKVLPRVGTTILRYYNTLLGVDRISSINLYITTNAFFDHYPRSGAFKVYHTDSSTMTEQLCNAMRLYCDGKTLTTIEPE